ncbi:MAG: tetraacyldisaccharide 4'-kinase [Candidatus Electryoneaceae bacterium]|nr:tetraacyldisaccharide 4'-kinase [Candidatus Electryoneaceae bacterium]
MKPHGWLWPLSIFYQAPVQLRNRFYNSGTLKSYKVDAPVISVGNISVGGTGKTPFVIHLIERLMQMKQKSRLKTAVISRGYRGRVKGTAVVSDGRRLFLGPEIAGDEPVMTAEAIPKSVVIVDKNRVRGASVAVEEYGADTIVLDDGFQHRRIRRDLDIVLLDARDPLGNGRVLPAGFLREPASALSRADLVILSKASGSDEELIQRAQKLEQVIDKPVVVTRLTPKYWRRFAHNELMSADQIAGKEVTAFAGIASPESFFDTVETLGADLKVRIPLPDHCPYKKRHLDWISRQYVLSRSEWIVTTAKDMIKLPTILHFLPVYHLETVIEIVAGEDHLHSALTDILQKTGKIVH